jgi:hypothetical protein
MNSKAIRITAVTTLLTVMLGGCQTLDPYTQESKTSRATKGAVIGAAAGAVAGLISVPRCPRPCRKKCWRGRAISARESCGHSPAR